MRERWQVLKEFPEYQISTHGRVKRTITNRILRPGACGSKRQYRMVTLYRNNKAYGRSVHRLVLETFRGPCPEGKEARHRDGNGANNKLTNLKWATRTRNAQDRIKHGTQTYGEKHGTSKLTERQVCFAWSSPLTAVEVAHQLGVTPGTIDHIRRGHTWVRITKNLPKQPKRIRRDQRGEKNPRAKLSKKDVRAIRRSKKLARILAERYGTTRQYINAIRCGLAWSWLT